MRDVPIRCRCGKVRGVALVSQETGFRVVCYCDDCQAFARFLKSDDQLDAIGGTDIFQMAPSRLHVTEGADQIRCMRLSEKGLLRWYAGCCDTALANTVSGRLPFVGVIHTCMDHAADGRSRDEALGPIRARVFGKFAKGGTPPGTHATSSPGLFLVVLKNLARWWPRRKPSPFFDPRTKAPRVAPRVLTKAERDALR